MWARSSSRTDPARWLGGLAALLLACGGGGPDRPAVLAVASSLRDVMPALVAAFPGSPSDPGFELSFGGSGALRRQVEAGAPVDAVVLAGADPVDALIDQGLADGRRTLARNELVLIVPAGGAPVTFETLDALPEGERIAIGDPDSVPVGRYARAALEALGSWERLEERLVFAPHVAAVLAFARRGEVGAAIVYRTDVRGIGDVEVRDTGRPPWAPTPEVVAAEIVGSARRGQAAALLTFAVSEPGAAILAQHGFTPPSR